MKLAKSEIDPVSGRDLLLQAASAEKAGGLQTAISAYKKLIRLHYRRQLAYQRLMIIYRKQKDSKKELETIKKAIEEFSKIIFVSKRLHSRKVEQLSQRLVKSIEPRGRKAIALHKPEPIAGWEIRKDRLEKKMRNGK